MSDDGPDGGGFAVVGTGTGVGKTVVTAAAVARLRSAGHDARGIKPVQTGHPPDDDASVVAEACGDDAAAVCFERLEPPLAPTVAARETGTTLDYAAIRDRCRRAVDDAGVGVVEGIGGLRVPLAGDREVVDLVADLGLPALVVGRSGLGTLNHTALTVDALRDCGVPVCGVVLDAYAGETVAERTNPEVLAGMLGRDVETLPAVDTGGPASVARTLADRVPASVLPDGLP
ncbi:MAG: dethiobiotin synthase [Haloferacaceae archaeon]